MQVQEKPMSSKRKIMAMYDGKFYLNPRYKQELVSMIERGLILTDRAAVDFIDENGEWLHDAK